MAGSAAGAGTRRRAQAAVCGDDGAAPILPGRLPVASARPSVRMHPHRKAVTCALGAVLAWSTVAAAFKYSLQWLRPVELLLVASLGSLLVLAGVLALRGGLGSLRRLAMRDWLASAGYGFLNPFLYYLVLFEAYRRLPAQVAQPLNYAWPLVLVLVSALWLRQRLAPVTLAAMALSLAGIVLISTQGELTSLAAGDPLGIALALASTLVWAGYWLANSRDRLDPVLRLCANFACGTLFVGLWWGLTGEPRPLALPGVLGAVYVGVFEMGLTFVLWLTALRHARDAAQVGGLVYLSPFLSLLFIHQVVGETIRTSTVFGLVLIVGGVLLNQLASRRRA